MIQTDKIKLIKNKNTLKQNTISKIISFSKPYQLLIERNFFHFVISKKKATTLFIFK